MSDRIGKYYWIKTEAGKEIGFKRDSGSWEMHGIDCTEDLRSEVLEVYEEVENGDIKQPEKALAIQGVSKSFTAEEVVNELEDCDTLDDAIMFFKEQM